MNKQETQSIDNLTQKELKVYNEAKGLEEEISGRKIWGVFVLLNAIGSASMLAMQVYATQCEQAGDNKYAWAWFGASAISTFTYGMIKRSQGKKERELYEIQNKKEYKKAEKFMNSKYEN